MISAIKARILGARIGQFVGFGLLGFTSVYREGFETALLLQALVLEAGHSSVLAEASLGLTATFAVGSIVEVQNRLPYKKMPVVIAVMLGGVLVIVGNTAHALQIVGWLPTYPLHPVDFPYWTGLWFGLYATWEGVALQAVSGVFVVGSYMLVEQLKERRRHTRPGTPKPMPDLPNAT